MKIKDGFIVREVAGQVMVMPTDGNFDGMITLNDTGAFIWKKLEEETTVEAIVEALLGEYDVDAQTATVCVKNFIAELEKHGFLA